MRFAITSLAVVLLSLTACSSAPKGQASAEDESMCKEVKPGVVTSVNHYCAVVNDDPVDPVIVTEFEGQKVGFCCKGCVPRWNAMTTDQKRAALAAAVAKGKPSA
ncbi:MAG: hypothetical protein JNM94_09850 [Phycisphaerae bacterium]|nr:hypothetical protein [Phycisphaerae bacterium]